VPNSSQKKIINLPNWQHRSEKPSYIKDIEGNKVVQPNRKRFCQNGNISLLTFDRLITDKQSCYRKKLLPKWQHRHHKAS